VPERAGELVLLDVLPLRGGGWRRTLHGGARLLAVGPEAWRVVRRLRPQVVFSVGGYAAGPVALVARALGVPLTLLEPNAVAGLTNRLLGPLARRVYTGFRETSRGFRADRVRWTGVPLRRRFEPSPPSPVPDLTRVLVLGGSQGAVALNETVPRALGACVRRGHRLRVTHQTGRGKDAQVAALYGELRLGVEVSIVPFIDDVAGALGAADLVVGRAGASSTAEICAVGRPSLLIPYPFAADDHQRRNAEALERAGAARCIPQSEAAVERLASELSALAGDPARRATMAARAAAEGRPAAARDVAADLLALAGHDVPEEGGR
jgi:UDP-N-acetylglucosamine--N-acetylmuramyl-(pentapeptide) pyrophosphoryl-undecaprenol N-acetylglucosamine transferase